MHQSMALAKGARITGGAFCLLFFLFTATWLVVDLSEFGIDGVWESWTFQNSGGINQVTNAFHFGLALVQLAAVFAAFAGQRVAAWTAGRRHHLDLRHRAAGHRQRRQPHQ